MPVFFSTASVSAATWFCLTFFGPNYFGRRSLGKIRGMGLLISQISGRPSVRRSFGFLFDATGGYGLSFAMFGAALMTSAFLSLMLKPPREDIIEVMKFRRLEYWSVGVLIGIGNPSFQYSITPLLLILRCVVGL